MDMERGRVFKKMAKRGGGGGGGGGGGDDDAAAVSNLDDGITNGITRRTR